jgi:hypothetical protein
MKRNTKKLALLMIIMVIASFLFAATATAKWPGHRAIRGQYAATGGATFLVAVCGFGDDYIPIYAAGGAWGIQTASIQAVFTFKSDGTGTASETYRVVHHYSIATSMVGLTPWAGIRNISYSFDYTIEKDGKIEITADPATIISTWISGPSEGLTQQISTLTLEGTIAPDGKTIILNGGLPEVATFTPPIDPRFPEPQLINNSYFVLIWQHDIDHK